MPLFGLGTSSGVSSLHVCPASRDVAESTLPAVRLRQTSANFPSDSLKSDGWIAPSVFSFSGGVLSHVRPRSRVHSMCSRQPSCSELDGQRIVPPAISIGLFLIGPRKPS